MASATRVVAGAGYGPGDVSYRGTMIWEFDDLGRDTSLGDVFRRRDTGPSAPAGDSSDG